MSGLTCKDSKRTAAQHNDAEVLPAWVSPGLLPPGEFTPHIDAVQQGVEADPAKSDHHATARGDAVSRPNMKIGAIHVVNLDQSPDDLPPSALRQS